MGLPIGWKDLVVLGEGTRVGASAPTFAAWNGGIYRLRFDDAQTNEIHFSWHIPHDYAPGTQVAMHVHWSPTTTNTGDCRWGFEYSYAAGYSTATFPATATIYALQAGSGVVDRHQIAETALTTIAGLETDGIITCRLFRDGTNGADTFTGNAWLHSIDLHYQASHVATVGRNTVGAWVPT